LFDSSVSHPACVGYYIQPFVEKGKVQKSPKPALNVNKCTKREYLEEYVFPLLMPALEHVLIEARKNKCFEVNVFFVFLFVFFDDYFF